MELLYVGYPIKAHCVSCGEVWTVSQKRVELGEVVAAVCGWAA